VLSNAHELLSAEVDSRTASVSEFSWPNAWLPATVIASIFSVGSGTANASGTSINTSFSLFSNEAFARAGVERVATITALATGLLTVSIPFQIQNHGPISGEWSSFTIAGIQFTNPDGTGGIFDGASL